MSLWLMQQYHVGVLDFFIFVFFYGFFFSPMSSSEAPMQDDLAQLIESLRLRIARGALPPAVSGNSDALETMLAHAAAADETFTK